MDLKHNLQSQALTQVLSVVLTLKNIGIKVWHTGETEFDTGEHSLTGTENKKLVFYPAYEQFWKIAKLLHHNITMEIDGNITIIRGRTSREEKTLIAWDNRKYDDFMGLSDNSAIIKSIPIDPPNMTIGNYSDQLILQKAEKPNMEGGPVICIFKNDKLVYKK